MDRGRSYTSNLRLIAAVAALMYEIHYGKKAENGAGRRLKRRWLLWNDGSPVTSQWHWQLQRSATDGSVLNVVVSCFRVMSLRWWGLEYRGVVPTS
ncbi:Hypothetical predicted protein [Olea europaea subsp. europaea]|uniref:Uncharacterized protein n=1 Tax=Olea europaea subsp. europaea TaxID=158383 RepID=A0A8S0QWB1_OLEEU|nr:Hypothetical predicted protein [Olea europaea subsp. europaea]